jgi:hypothetical protein
MYVSGTTRDVDVGGVNAPSLIAGWLPASYRFCMHCKAARSMEWSQWTARVKQVTQAPEDLELSYRVDEIVAYSRWVMS